MLLDEARAAGADVREETTREKHRCGSTDGDVAVETDAGETLTARYLIDASGQGTVARPASGHPRAGKRAAPSEGRVLRAFRRRRTTPGREEGHPAIVMCDEGWFWLINIDERRTSIGLVLDAQRRQARWRPRRPDARLGHEPLPARPRAMRRRDRPGDEPRHRQLQLPLPPVRRRRLFPRRRRRGVSRPDFLDRRLASA